MAEALTDLTALNGLKGLKVSWERTRFQEPYKVSHWAHKNVPTLIYTVEKLQYDMELARDRWVRDISHWQAKSQALEYEHRADRSSIELEQVKLKLSDMENKLREANDALECIRVLLQYEDSMVKIKSIVDGMIND